MKFEIKQSVYFIETNIAINKAYEISYKLDLASESI